MDDSSDGPDSVSDSLNGESKPYPAKLAQTAIIKQDVMLSGVSAVQSSSSSLSSVNHASAAIAANASLAASLFGNALAGSQSALMGVAAAALPPQYILAGGGAAAAAGAGAAGSGGPVQQLVIPVSLGNGSQQLISIPLSLATGAGSRIQLLATNGGQLIATNLAGSSAAGGAADIVTSPSPAATVQPLVILPTLGQSQTANIATLPLAANQAAAASAMAAAAGRIVAGGSASVPQILTNAQGQILAIGTPQLLSQAFSLGQSLVQGSGAQSVVAPDAALARTATTAKVISTPSGLQLVQVPAGTKVDSTSPALAAAASAAGLQLAVANATGGLAVLKDNPGSPTSAEATIASITQLLPNTISSAGKAHIVDGVDLDEIRRFAKEFKLKRLSLGLTQTQVGHALSATIGPSYSQSAICRFEKLDITPKSAQKIKPVLERWMKEAEERYKNGVNNLSEFVGSEPSKKRKRRTSFTPQALEALNEYFKRNSHPTGAEISQMGEKMNYDREVIRVWFCNKRQALKNTIKKLKPHDS